MATIKEVAALAGVSIGTVSHVLSGVRRVHPAIRIKVEEAVRQLGYRPNLIARSLKSRRTHALGMVISDITNPFFPELMRGAEDAALARGYLLTTFNTDDSPERERQIFELLESRRMDGLLVVVALKRGKHPHVAKALAAETPVVCLDRRPRDLAVDSVTVDNTGGVEAAVQYLLDSGYRDIAYIGGAPGMYLTADRLKGYKRAMSRAGLLQRAFEGDFRRESGHRLMSRIIAAGRLPEAVFTANILMAAGALEALNEHGLSVPDDIALASFDSVAFLKGFRPQLTCVAQPTYEMGFRGANLLMDRLEGLAPSSEPQHVQLPCELRIAESTQRTRSLTA
jgi:LacI family transcriptional regulator